MPLSKRPSPFHEDQERLLDPDCRSQASLDVDIGHRCNAIFRRASLFPSLKLAFVASTLLNALLLYTTLWPKDVGIPGPDISLYAGLPRNFPVEFEPYSMYGLGNKNETDRSLMWESLVVSMGNVALDHKWAERKSLPRAQPFPWDQEKGIYLVNGYHSLHCLRKVRRWVTISYHNGTQVDSYSHVVHCMSHLLNDIICQADDTPVYTTSGHKKDVGRGQARQCRSWDALNEWAEHNTACYAFINETQGVDNMLERYKWCPKDSPYIPLVRQYMGLPSDWHRERPLELESVPPYWEDIKHNELVFDEEHDI